MCRNSQTSGPLFVLNRALTDVLRTCDDSVPGRIFISPPSAYTVTCAMQTYRTLFTKISTGNAFCFSFCTRDSAELLVKVQRGSRSLISDFINLMDLSYSLYGNVWRNRNAPRLTCRGMGDIIQPPPLCANWAQWRKLARRARAEAEFVWACSWAKRRLRSRNSVKIMA